MITKERLDKLIKQGATICRIIRKSKIEEIKLDKNHCDITGSFLFTEEYGYELDKLFETKERAEWALKTYAERTERFEPPFWEDIKDKGYIFRTVVRDDYLRFITSRYTIELKFLGNDEYYFCEPATKENYIKACEMVRDLFKGEK